jgi:hypothetical protein
MPAHNKVGQTGKLAPATASTNNILPHFPATKNAAVRNSQKIDSNRTKHLGRQRIVQAYNSHRP